MPFEDKQTLVTDERQAGGVDHHLRTRVTAAHAIHHPLQQGRRKGIDLAVERQVGIDRGVQMERNLSRDTRRIDAGHLGHRVVAEHLPAAHAQLGEGTV